MAITEEVGRLSLNVGGRYTGVEGLSKARENFQFFADSQAKMLENQKRYYAAAERDAAKAGTAVERAHSSATAAAERASMAQLRYAQATADGQVRAAERYKLSAISAQRKATEAAGLAAAKQREYIASVERAQLASLRVQEQAAIASRRRVMHAATTVGMGIGAAGLGIGYEAVRKAMGEQAAQAGAAAQYRINPAALGAYAGWIGAQSPNLLQTQSALWQGVGRASIAGYGLRGTEATAAGASKLAAIFKTELLPTTGQVAAILRAFHVTAGAIPRTLDMIGAAASRSGQGMAIYSGATGKALLAAYQAGVPLQTVLGAVSGLARQMPGQGGRIMGTLGTLIANLSTPSSAMLKAVGGQGAWNQIAVPGNLLETLSHIFAFARGNTGVERSILGGGMNVTLARTLMGAGAGGGLGQTAGFVKTGFGIVSSSTQAQFEKMQLSIEAMTIKLGQALIPIMQKFLAVLVPVINTVSKWTQQHPALAAGIIKVAIGIGLASVALRGLNVVMSASTLLMGPQGLVVLGVLAGAAAFYLAYTRIKLFRDGVNRMLPDLTNLFLHPMTLATQTLNWFKAHSLTVLPQLLFGPFSTVLVYLTAKFAPGLFNAILTPFNLIQKFLQGTRSKLYTYLIKPFLDAANAMLGIGKLILQKLAQGIVAGYNLLPGPIKWVLDKVAAPFKALAGITFFAGKSAVTSLGDGITAATAGAVTKAQKSGAAIGAAFTAGFLGDLSLGLSPGQKPSTKAPFIGAIGSGMLGAGAGKNAPSVIPAAMRQWWPYISKASQATGVPGWVIAAYMSGESSGNPTAQSSAGAYGLMQLMPRTASGLGVNMYDPYQNILGGARLIRQGMGTYGSNWRAIYENVYNPGITNTPNDAGYQQILRALATYGQGGAPVGVGALPAAGAYSSPGTYSPPALPTPAGRHRRSARARTPQEIAVSYWQQNLADAQAAFQGNFGGQSWKQLSGPAASEYMKEEDKVFWDRMQLRLAQLNKWYAGVPHTAAFSQLFRLSQASARGEYRGADAHMRAQFATLPIERAISSETWQRQILLRSIQGEKPWELSSRGQQQWLNAMYKANLLQRQIWDQRNQELMLEGKITAKQYAAAQAADRAWANTHNKMARATAAGHAAGGPFGPAAKNVQTLRIVGQCDPSHAVAQSIHEAGRHGKTTANHAQTTAKNTSAMVSLLRTMNTHLAQLTHGSKSGADQEIDVRLFGLHSAPMPGH